MIDMMNFEELKRVAVATIGEGVVESWAAEVVEESGKVLKIHVNGLILRGFVVITPTEKEKYFNVAFESEEGEIKSTHKTSRGNLAKLIDAHVERAKEWTDEEYKRRYMANAKASGVDDVYNAMEMLRDGVVEHVMLFDTDGTPLECTKKDGNMLVTNTKTGEVLYKMEIAK